MSAGETSRRQAGGGGQAAAMLQAALDAGIAAEDDGRRLSAVQRQWVAVAPASPATPAAD